MKKLFKTIVSDKLLLSLSVILLLIVGVSGSLIVVKATGAIFRSSPEVEVIDLTNLKESEIKDWYEGIFGTTNGLEFIEVYDEKIAEGEVVSQKPEKGERVNLDTGLKVEISKGKDPDRTFELPDFVKENYDKEKIEKYFEENGFTNVTYEYKVIEDDDSKKDTVLAVNKSGLVKRSDTILVTLSAGGEADLIEVKVPDFSTYTESEAKKWANSYTINLSFEYVFSNTYAQGKIIGQSVDKDTIVKGGSSIKLTVSKGKGITIADLVGKTQDQAKNYASENGFKINVKYAYSDSVEKGLIISSSPSKGGMLAKGDTLTVTISQGVDPNSKKIKVDDYAGKSESALLSYLEEIGMKATKESAVYSDKVNEGLVAYNTNGEIVMSQGVQYALSLGKYTIDVDDFNGSSLASAQALVKKANDMGANITFRFNESSSSEYDEDELFGCYVSSSGKVITCNLSTGSSGSSGGSSSGKTSYIMNDPQSYEGRPLSLDNTLATIKNSLGMFDNLKIKYVTSGQTAGTVLSIKVNGKSFTSGQYDTGSTVIEITVVEKQSN